jgi:hypothetical protein
MTTTPRTGSTPHTQQAPRHTTPARETGLEPHDPANPDADRLNREESDAATEALIAAMKARDAPGFKAWSDALGAALGPHWPAEVRARGVARVRELLRDVQPIGSIPSAN